MLNKFHFPIVFIVLLLCIGIYWPSFSVPFYLDDFDSIVNNDVITSLSWQAIDAKYPMRELAYFSFALNYSNHADAVFGYHLVNLCLHLLMGLGVFLLARKCTDFIQLQPSESTMLAFCAMTLFLIAPLNTQAVTYVVQRIAILSALFYVFALVFYLFARTRRYSITSLVFYFCALLCFIAGLHAKQNIVTLPISILVMEYWLIRRSPNVLLKSLPVMTFFLGALVLTDVLMGSKVIDFLDQVTKEAGRINRWEYFTHQLSALWIYLYKFFVPYPLLLEYGSTPKSWQDYSTWLSAFGHMTALFTIFLYRFRAPLLTSLGLLFYITHSVESSVIPISDLMFEHRAYLPNVFVSVFASFLFVAVWRKNKLIMGGLGLSIVLLFSVLTYKRNLLWGEPIEFYRNELTHTADNSRAYGAVGLLYAEAGNYRKAQRWFKMAVQVGAETKHLQISTILQYMTSLYNSGKVSQASRIGTLALKVATRNIDKARILIKLAEVKAGQGLCDFADNMIKRSVSLAPELSNESFSCTPIKFKLEKEG